MTEDDLIAEADSLLPGEVDEVEEKTSNSEIFGWCLYSWAAEPFIVSAVSTYVPLLLEQFARENGVRLDDHSQPCILPNDPMPPILPPPSVNGTLPTDPTYLFSRSMTNEAATKCVLYVLGHYIDTSSYALYTFSTSVLIQTLTVISMSGAADRGHYRKNLLITFAIIGSISTMLYIVITSKRYYIASLLAMVAISSFGAVNVCGNSFLPILVLNHPDLNKDSKTNLITKLSGRGAATGYLAALICQFISIFIVLKTGSTTMSIQYAIFFIGVWWFSFQLPIYYLLKSRKSKSLNLVKDQSIVLQYIKYGWKTLFISIKHASMLKDVLIFLLGWFILSDSVVTINSAAVLFAKTELQMSTINLVIIGILSVIFAIIGSLTIPFIQKRFNINTKYFLIFIILWTSIIPFYGILGFIFKIIGLKHKFEMYLLAIWYGISMGGLTTLTRSLFSLLIPKGKESVFFSLFSITDKGSSIIGPIITGLIIDRYHNIRYSFFFLLFLLIISIPIFASLDVERGEKEAKELEIVEE